MIDNDVDQKVRKYQAKILQETNKTFSFSSAINEVLRKNLK